MLEDCKPRSRIPGPKPLSHPAEVIKLSSGPTRLDSRSEDGSDYESEDEEDDESQDGSDYETEPELNEEDTGSE